MTPIPRLRRAVTALAAVLVLSSVSLATTTTAGAIRTADEAATLLLQSQSGWVAPTGTFRMNIRMPSIPPGAEIVASLYQRVTTQSALDRTGNGESLPGRLAQVTVPADQAPVVAGAVDLSFPIVESGPTPPYGFSIGREGVYPFGLSLIDDQGDEIGELFTHLVRLPDADSASEKTPLTVALVVPIGAPVAHQPDGSVAVEPEQQAALEQLVTTLGQTPGVPLTLTPTPETVSSMSERDRSNNTKVVSSLTSASRGRQLLSGPWVNVDSGAWVDQGLTDDFGRQLAFGSASLESLLGIASDTHTTVVDATTSNEVMGAVAIGGADKAVVPSGRLEPTSKTGRVTALTQTFDLTSSNDDRIRSVAADDALAARLVTGDDRVLAAHEVVASLSLLALSPSTGGCVTDADQCSRGLALQLPASAAEAQIPLSVLLDAFADRTGTGAAPEAVGGQAIISPMSVDNLLKVVDPASESGRTRPDVPVQRRELTSVNPAGLGPYPTQLRATQSRVEGFRSMVTVPAATDAATPGSDAQTVTSGLDLAVSLDQVVLSSGSVAFDEPTRTDYLGGADARIDDQLAQITTEEQTLVTLTSRDGTIPLTVNNGLDYPVQVRIALKSDKLDFPNGAVMQDVLLAPRVPTRVDVPVQARASGAFKLEATITSPDNGLRITSGEFNVRSTAVSGVGLVLTIAAGLFLLLWWARHFRKTRRDKRLIASDHPSIRSDAAPTSQGNGSGSPSGAISYAPADRD